MEPIYEERWQNITFARESNQLEAKIKEITLEQAYFIIYTLERIFDNWEKPQTGLMGHGEYFKHIYNLNQELIRIERNHSFRRRITLTSSAFNVSKCFAVSTLDLMFSTSWARCLSLANCVSLLIFLDTSELWGLCCKAIWKASKDCSIWKEDTSEAKNEMHGLISRGSGL